MRTFLINLDRNPDRLVSAKRQLDAFGIAFERFPGIDGRALSKDELKRHYNRFRSILVNGKPMALGEIGCALSHTMLYRKMVEENIPFALIFEDDVKLTDRFPEMLAAAVKFLDVTRKQVVLFTRHGLSEAECAAERGVVPIRGGLCAEAYLITLPAAREIVRVNYPIVIINDKWRRFQRHFGVELYRTLPATADQDKRTFGVSDVLQTHPTYRGLMWVMWKLARCIEVPLDRLIIAVTGR